MSASIYWLIIGVVFIGLEAFGLPGIGLFFAGIGAFLVGVIIEAGLITSEAIIAQCAWFFAFTSLSAALLWKPMQKWRLTRGGDAGYSNMVGERATVTGEPLVKHKEGKVLWSGTVMIGELVSDSAAESVAVGEYVYIKSVKGAKLFVDIN